MRLIALSAIAATMCVGTALAQMMPPVDEEATIGEQWDQRYGMDRYIYGTEPVEFLVDQINRLPTGRALCLAAGEGRYARAKTRRRVHLAELLHRPARHQPVRAA